jgi:hypothetical protein
MKNLSSFRSLLMIAVVAIALLPLLACGSEEAAPDLQPNELEGTWEDDIDKGRILLSPNGTYQYINASAGPPGFIEGQGQWEAEGGGILIKLTSGQSTNFQYTLQSPTEMRWSYRVLGDALTFVELTGLRQTANYTRMGN